MAQCTATAKSTGERCKRPTVNGTTKCRYHGGLSLRGAASPTFKDGSRSKYAPAQIARRYEEALDDPRLLDLTSNIALREAFIRERLEALGHGGDLITILDNLKANYQDLHTAYYAADSSGMRIALERYRLIIEDGRRYDVMRNEIENALDNQSRDIEREKRLKLQGEHAASADEIAFIMKSMMGYFTQEFMNDRKRLNKALGFLDELFFRGHPELVAGDTPASSGNGRVKQS